ncbi:MAG: LysR family transcriptional regulator [Terrimicrobiaceae bacterium]
MELRWIRSFVAVAEEMHFSRAARRLHIAQPALTAHIRQLEQAVGAPLFDRSNRMRGLTPAGGALLSEARALLERTGQLPAMAVRAALGETGSLRAGVIPPAATGGLAEVFRMFSERMPGVALSVRMGGQDRLMAALVAGELDLVVGRPEHPPRGSGIRERRLFREEQGLLLRADDPLAAKPSVPVRALDGRKLLLLRDNLHFGQMLLEHAARHRTALLPVHDADDFPALQWMVRAGLGIAPTSLLLTPPDGLTARPLLPALPKLDVCAIWRGNVPAPPVARWLQQAGKRVA